MSKFNLEEGSNLTFSKNILDNSGRILFKKGDVATVSELIIKPASVGRKSGVYYPEQIEAVRIEEAHGIWYGSAFVEPFM